MCMPGPGLAADPSSDLHPKYWPTRSRFESGLSTARTDDPERDRLQGVSTAGLDTGGLQGTPGDSIDGPKRRGIKALRRKSCTISLLVDSLGSGSTGAASTMSSSTV